MTMLQLLTIIQAYAVALGLFVASLQIFDVAADALARHRQDTP